MRTPRSVSKQQQQQHGKGQTKVNQFFSPLIDGSSRESDTPSAAWQHREHQHQQQQQQQQQQQHQPMQWQQASPIEGLIEQQQQPASTPSAWAATVGHQSAANEAAAGVPVQLKNSSEKPSADSSSGYTGAAPAGQRDAVVQQQIAALQQKHQQELELVREEAR